MRPTSSSVWAAIILGLFVALCVFLLPSVAFAAKAPPVHPPGVDPPSYCDSVAGNLVVNCGFESGDWPPGWTPVPATPASCSFFFVDNGPFSTPHSGNWDAVFAGVCPGSYDAIQQTIPTSAGQPYQLSFWLDTGSNGVTRDFQVYWNGALIYDNSATGTGVYTQYSFVVIGTGSDTLKFQAYDVEDFDDLDDVVLTALPTAARIHHFANLNAGDSFIDISNTGSSGSNLCANVYTFSPDEQMISCCSCPVTPNGLNSLSAKGDLISNVLTPSVPTSIVVKLIATTQPTGGCNAATIGSSGNTPIDGLVAWGGTLHAAPTPPLSHQMTETEFTPYTSGAGEVVENATLCRFIGFLGSGFGTCKSCRTGGLGGAHQ
jgi:hypothetical protein